MKYLLTRFTALVLVLAALIGVFPCPASAAETATISGTCGENAVWVLEGNTLTISGTGSVVNDLGEEDNWDAYADQVEYVIVEEGITGLDDCVFLQHENLLSIELPDSLEVIGTQVFQGCDKITQFTIPKNVRQIAGNDWEGRAASGTFSCSALENVFVDPENERYYDEDGVLFDQSTNALLVYPYGRTDTTYQVPDGIERIGYGAFWLTCLDEVSLPESVTVIEGSAFYAADISRMEFPKNLTRIGSMAFQNCKHLTEATLFGNIERIEEYAFSFCDSLEDVTILSPDCLIYARNDSFPKSTVLHGYSGSTTENHAKRFGYDFVDVETGEVRYYNVGNTGFMAQLPTDLTVSAPAYNCVHSPDENGNIVQYQPTMTLERDTSNKTYQEILAKVEELTDNCSDDMEKAKCIQRWVTENMTYEYWGAGDGRVENTYIYWKERSGNCMAYTQLTNFMLYLAGFPVAALSGEGHSWSAALIDGRWVMIDSTNGLFDVPYEDCDEIADIFFSLDDTLIFALDDLTGVKLAFYGLSMEDHKNYSEITIPEYVTHIYKSMFFFEDYYCSPTTHLTIRGTAGSYSESYLRENLPHYNDYTYENGMFTAKVVEEHTHSFGEWIVVAEPTDKQEGLAERYCSCGETEQKILPKTGARFSDVCTEDYFYEPVLWAVENGITGGTSDSTFSPYASCTRAQVVTFLWAAEGRPEPVTSENPFTDVSPTAYYYKAVLWAVENGITSGVGNGRFGPGQTCTRGQIVTFLYKAYQALY